MKLQYGRIIQDRLDGEHGLPRRRLDELAAPLRRRAGGGAGAPRRRRVRLLPAGRAGADDPADLRLRRGPRAGVRPRPGARHRRLGARHPGAPLRAPSAGLERARRRGPGVLPAAHPARQRGPDLGGRRAAPHRPAARAGERDQQVGRHRRDAGAVPRGAALARRGAGRGRQPAPGVHHRPGQGRAARARRAGGDRHAGGAAGGGRALQRALAGGAAAGGAGRDRHRGAGAGRRAPPWSAAEADDLLQNPAALYAALHWSADLQAGARLHVLMPYSDRLRDLAEWFRQLWAESLGKRVDREGKVVHSGPDAGGVGRGHRPALAGAALHGRAVRQAHHLRDGGRPGRGRPDSRARGDAGGGRLPRRPDAGRAAQRGVRGHLGGAGPDGPDELHPRAARPLAARRWGNC